MDLLELLLDFLLLHLVLRVNRLLELLLTDGFRFVPLVYDDAFALETFGDGLEVVLHSQHGFVDLVDLCLGALEEGVDVTFPAEGVDPWLEVLVHLDDLGQDERALDLV